MRQKNRIQWVDIVKFIGMLAVLILHTEDILYSNRNIFLSTCCSVSIFIFAMGVTTMWSFSKNDIGLNKKVFQKSLGILKPYVVATLLYGVFYYKSFDFLTYFNHLINFNMSGPLYYVALYVQLVIVSPIIYYIFKISSKKSYGLLIEIAGFLATLVIGSLTTNYSSILGIYGGGGKLFGGTFLIILYIGMWFGKYCNRINLKPVPATFISALFFVLTFYWYSFITKDALVLDSKLPFGDGYNPHGVSFGLFAILIVLSVFFASKVFNHFTNCLLQSIINAFAYIGRHTLYIFLYHRFFLDILFLDILVNKGIVFENIYIKRVVFFSGMIFGSIFLEFLLKRLGKILINCYK